MCHVEKSTPGQLGISSIELSVQRVESGGELSKTATTDIMNLQVRKTLIFLTIFQDRKIFDISDFISSAQNIHISYFISNAQNFDISFLGNEII